MTSIPKGCSFLGPRASRFKGYQQQDSHELLRYLLDGMRAEEIKVGRNETTQTESPVLPDPSETVDREDFALLVSSQ